MILRCDTCGKEVDEVRRIVIRKNYDRSRALPRYNCNECFEKKRTRDIAQESR